MRTNEKKSKILEKWDEKEKKWKKNQIRNKKNNQIRNEKNNKKKKL